jgi:hypothetical protein
MFGRVETVATRTERTMPFEMTRNTEWLSETWLTNLPVVSLLQHVSLRSRFQSPSNF